MCSPARCRSCTKITWTGCGVHAEQVLSGVPDRPTLCLSVSGMGLFGLFGSVPKVNAAEARQLVDDGAVLLDVREKSEWNAGHAPQAAHLPLGRIAEASRKVRQGRRVVVMCRSGNRSRSATKSLIGMGYDAVNLAGGIGAWQRAGGAVVDRSGRRA